MPRRLKAPEPPLADDEVRLEPLDQSSGPELLDLLDDPEIGRYTRVPTGVDRAWVSDWIARYECRWEDGNGAGFTIRGRDGSLLGWAGLVELDLDRREGEIGYMVAPAARGRGVACRTVGLLTRWGFDELGLERLELRIHPENVASTNVAERAGYRLDGVLRNLLFKEGRRADVGVWSRLSQD